MTTALQRPDTPAESAHKAAALLGVIEAAGPATILLDRGYASHMDGYLAAEPFVQALEADLARRYRILELPGPGGGFWQLAPSATDRP